jgi:hypothetical protein
MSRRFVVRAPWCVAAALVLLVGCGGSDEKSPSAESPKPAAVVVDSSQTYRDRLAEIVSQPDDARRNFHDAPTGVLTLAAARELAGASRAAARNIEELTPAAGLDDMNRDLGAKYRLWAAALDRELLRKPVSTRRLGDAVREYGKAADAVYEQILIAP